MSTNSVLNLDTSTFIDVGLQYQDQDIDPALITDRLGGAVAAKGGTVIFSGCSFTRVSALPNDMQLSSCAKVATQPAQ